MFEERGGKVSGEAGLLEGFWRGGGMIAPNQGLIYHLRRYHVNEMVIRWSNTVPSQNGKTSKNFNDIVEHTLKEAPGKDSSRISPPDGAHPCAG